MSLILRDMNRCDIRAVSDLDYISFSEGWTESMYEGELDKDVSHYFVVTDGDDIVGFAGIWCIYETAEIARIAVKADMRRRGIGAALMNSLIKHAGNKGCERILLEVNENNDAARKMYEKFGFVKIDIRKNYYKDGSAVIMQLDLRNI